MWRKVTQPSTRRLRVRLLDEEANVQREAAAERARSVQNKASFLVIAAGFLAGSAFLSPKEVWWIIAILPPLFALATVILAAVALWPANLDVIGPRELKRQWVDSDKSDYALEMFLLECKVVEWEELQARTNSRVKALKAGFVFLALAVAATLAVVSAAAIH